MQAVRFAGLLLCAALLTSCASNEATDKHQLAQTQFAALVNAKPMVFYELTHPFGLSQKELEAEEHRVFDAMSPVCLKPYSERMAGAINHAAEVFSTTGDRRPVDRLPGFARLLDDFFTGCIETFGAKGFNYMQTEDGRKLSLPDFVGLSLSAAEFAASSRVQVELERQQNMALIGGLAVAFGAGMSGSQGWHPVNPDQILVGGYLKRDGSLVQGHWRTVPNFTCLDNINGCR